MLQNLRNTWLEFYRRQKQVSSVWNASCSVTKYRLCVAMRRASFRTRSSGANCGPYGGKNSNVSTIRYLCDIGARWGLWLQVALTCSMYLRFARRDRFLLSWPWRGRIVLLGDAAYVDEIPFDQTPFAIDECQKSHRSTFWCAHLTLSQPTSWRLHSVSSRLRVRSDRSPSRQ